METEEQSKVKAECRRKALKIVEDFLEDSVEESFLLECANHINQDYYTDVVEERFIIKRCGYPLCDEALTEIPQQKYHISVAQNRVYELTERKKFCSNNCFKASNYYAGQLSTEPVWAMESRKLSTIQLLPHNKDKKS
eukprot:m.8249 g.8249  ORF g.8249 m.8249 type:complete len:138 (+) comp20445_c0_seq1:156-569(+)